MQEIYGYARVSTNEQAQDKGALLKQLRRLRSAGATKLYWDVESRTSDTRSGLMSLIKDVESSPNGSVLKFLFVRVDRLTSSYKVFYKLMDALAKKNIKPEALDEHFDIASCGGKLTVNVRLAAAEYEVEMTSLRVSKELGVRRSQNKPHSHAPMGYVAQDEIYKFDNREAVCLISQKKVFTYAELMRFTFNSFFEIGTINKTVATLHETFGINYKTSPKGENKKTNVINLNDEINLENTKNAGGVSYGIIKWTVSGLRKTLINPIYAGGTLYDGIIRWGTHDDVIISREEYEEIKKIITKNKNNRWATEQRFTNPYAYIIKCDRCGAAYSRQAKKLVKRTGLFTHHYQCSKYKTKTCDNKTMISSTNLESQLIQILILEAKKLVEMAKIHAGEEGESAELIEKKHSLAELEKLPPFPALEKAKQELRDDISLILNSTTKKSLDYIIAKDLIIEAFSDSEDYWQHLNNEDKAVILKGCIRRILVDGNRITKVEFKY